MTGGAVAWQGCCGAGQNPQDFMVLRKCSARPVRPRVARGRCEWFSVARWTLFALIEAELAV